MGGSGCCGHGTDGTAGSVGGVGGCGGCMGSKGGGGWHGCVGASGQSTDVLIGPTAASPPPSCGVWPTVLGRAPRLGHIGAKLDGWLMFG